MLTDLVINLSNNIRSSIQPHIGELYHWWLWDTLKQLKARSLNLSFQLEVLCIQKFVKVIVVRLDLT